MANEEFLPLVDEDGNVLGKASRKECHTQRLLHPVVHLHVVDKDGKLLLQKRSATKLIQPGKWDTAVGGHVDYGESIEAALRREAWEEIGLEKFECSKIDSYVWDCAAERELVNSFMCISHSDFAPRIESGEADDLQFLSRDEIKAMIDADLVTPNFVYEYRNYLRTAIDDK